MASLPEPENATEREARLARLFALHRQVMGQIEAPADASAAHFREERVVSPGFARHFQDRALASMTTRPSVTRRLF